MTWDAAAEAARLAELQRLAFGRASSPAEAQQAAAAAQELQQLLADREARAATTTDGDAGSSDDPAATDHATRPRPWWRRPPALAGALAVALVLGSAIVAAFAPPGPPAAFSVFDGAPDEAESALAEQLTQLGVPADELRVVAQVQEVRLVAFRAPAGTAALLAPSGGSVTGPFLPLSTEEARDAEQDVCLMILDRGRAGATTCSTVDDFVAKGLIVTSRGDGVFQDSDHQGTWRVDGSADIEQLTS